MTAKVFALSVLPIGSAILLLFFALDAAKKFAPTDPARIPFAGIPLLIAIVLVAVVALVLTQFLNREITIEEQYLIYRDSKAELHLEIAKMAYSPPADGGFLKVLMFSDGETFVQIPEMFLGDAPFAQLCEEIGKRRRRARAEGRDTYSL